MEMPQISRSGRALKKSAKVKEMDDFDINELDVQGKDHKEGRSSDDFDDQRVAPIKIPQIYLNLAGGQKRPAQLVSKNPLKAKTEVKQYMMDESCGDGSKESGDVEGFKCDICGAVFTSPSVLRRHRRRHPHMESDKRHQCHLCSYSTDITTNLRKHLLTHSHERPHQCCVCNKAFTQKIHLQNHLLLHTGECPFSCSTCGKTFNYKSTLCRHELIHSGERPYRCPHCEFRTSHSSNLRAHIVCKHKLETPDTSAPSAGRN